jgi:iron complex transport system substrate-binding protein
MRRTGIKVFSAGVAVLALSGALAACGDDGGGSSSASGDVVTVVDGNGNEVEMPQDPQRVFGMYTTDLDYALALGLSVAPTQAIRTGSTELPEFFPQDELGGVEDVFVNYPEFNYEKIAAVQPDLIINGLGYDGGADAERLGQIAPTYTFDGFGGDWREDLTALAEALGREDRAQEYLDRLDTRTAEVAALIADREAPPVVAYGYYNGDGSGGFYGPQLDQLQPIVFHDVGIETTAAAPDIWTEVAQEQVGLLADVDILMIAYETTEDPDAILDAIRADPVWSALPAVVGDRVVMVNNELSYSSPSAHMEFLDVLADALPLLP